MKMAKYNLIVVREPLTQTTFYSCDQTLNWNNDVYRELLPLCLIYDNVFAYPCHSDFEFNHLSSKVK